MNCRSHDHSGRSPDLARSGFAVALIAVAVVGCGGGDATDATASEGNRQTALSVKTKNPAQACMALAGAQIPAKAFDLPTGGATITSAELQAPDATSGQPEFCKVLGAIAAANIADPPINFEVNLPSDWNGKTVQFGGGGFNGTVVTGLGNVPHAPATAKTPLTGGYATFGSDSGSTPDGTFGMNATALANYGGESVNKTHNVAVAIMKTYYKKGPKRTFYVGGSKGGHEGLVAAQRYGKDYDGVVAYYPANQNQAMVLSWFRMWEAAYRVPGGFLNGAKQQLLTAKVLESCDALDGLVDGVVGSLDACGKIFQIGALRCPGGIDTGDTCLSDTQISTLMSGATPMAFAFPLAHGVQSIGPYPVFEAGDITGAWMDTNGVPQANGYGFFTDPVIRYFIQQNPASTTVGFDYRAWQPRVQEISRIYDATDPNIDAFKRRNGKLLLIQGTTDMLVTHTTTSAYYERLKDRYGDKLRNDVRYYVIPGFGHGGGAFSHSWDSLAALEEWVEENRAPSNPVTVDVGPSTSGRARPMCEFPLFPKYDGSGDPTKAMSFSCSSY
jgi:pimeloyl-ACP methyl ester carboxylesterase